MIFFTDNSGTIIKSVPSPVYQGSANTNNVYLVAPFAVNAAVTVAFSLPNGERKGPYTMTAQNALDGVQDAQGRTYAGWSFSMPNAVTQFFGTVGMQFYFYAAANGALTATSLTSFEVKRGVAPELPEVPDEDVYAEILAALAQIQTDLENGVYVARAVFPWQSTTAYGENEIVFYPSVGEYGAFVRSVADANLGHAPYDAEGNINTLWWAEVVNFNTVTEDFFTQVKNALEEAQQAAEDAQNAAESVGALVGKQVRFVTSEADMTQEGVLYGVVTDAGAKLFDLYVVKNGAPEKIGSANLVMNVTTYYSGVLTPAGWQDNAQTLAIDGVTADDDAEVSPINEDAASYVTNGIEATATASGGVVFTCATVPEDAITVIVGITKKQEIPNANGYYTEAEVDQKFEDQQTQIENGSIVAGEAEKVSNPLTITVNGVPVVYDGSSGKTVAVNTEGGFAQVAVTIAASAWSGGTVTLTSADYPALSAVAANSLVQFYAGDDSAAQVAENNVRLTAQAVGSVTFSCDTAPADSVSGTILIFN